MGAVGGLGSVTSRRLRIVETDEVGSGARRPGALGRALRASRAEAGWTQETLAARAEVSVRTISDLERGIHLVARVSTLDRLADALGLGPRDRDHLRRLGRGDTAPPGALPAVLRQRAGESPLVGRDRLLGAIAEVWSHVESVGPAAALLVGEAGVGKSRLLTESALAILGTGAQVLAGRCDEGLATPYGAIADAIRACYADSSVEEIAADLGALAPPLASILPELATVVAPVEADRDPDVERQLLDDAIERVLEKLAGGRPLLLVVDDIHAAPAPTLDRLRAVLLSPRLPRVLLLAAARDTEVTANGALGAFLETLHRHRLLVRWEVDGLGLDDVGQLIATATGEVPSGAIVSELHRQTAGNPFFVEEILRDARDRQLALGDALERVPTGVRDVVAQRVARLGDAAREALELAAVIGTDVERRLVERIVGPATLDGFDEAIARGFVDEAGGRISFRHGIVRGALVRDLTRARTAKLHWQVGEALERAHAHELDQYLADIAHHMTLGIASGDHDKASAYLERLADQQFRGLALDEAVQSLTSALEFAGDDAAGDRRRLRMMQVLAEVHFWRGDPDAMRSVALDAAQLAERCGSTEQFAVAVVIAGRWNSSGIVAHDVLALIDAAEARLDRTDGALQSQLLSMRGYVLQAGAGGAATRELAQRALAMARRIDDPESIAMALTACLYTYAGTPGVRTSFDAASELMRVAELVPSPSHAAQYRVFSLRGRAFNAACRGDRVAFDTVRAELGETADGMRAAFVRGQVAFADAAFAAAEGRYAAAVEASAAGVEAWQARPDARRVHLLQSAALGLETGAHVIVLPQIDAALSTEPSGSIAYAWRAAAAAGLATIGRDDEARRRLDDLAARDFAGLQADHNGPQALRWLAEATALLDAREHAAALLRIVEPFSGLVLVGAAVSTIEAAADRAIGQLLTVLDRHDEAIDAYTRAADLESRAGFVALETRTQLWWVRALRARAADGDAERAWSLHAHAMRRASHLGLAFLPEDRAESLGPPA